MLDFSLASASDIEEVVNLGAEFERITGKKPTLEGVKSGTKSDTWTCADMGNIIVHIMDESTRKHYDLESLWALGEQFDPKLQFEEDELDFLSDLYKSDQSQHDTKDEINNEEDPWKYFDKNG